MLWIDKECPSCGRKIKEKFRFCPYCGEELVEEKIEARAFRDIFEDVEKEFERIDRIFGSEFFQFPKIGFKPLTRGGGISVTIHSISGKEPNIEVKTFGDYKKYEPQLKRRLGIKPPVEEVEEEKAERATRAKVAEEPETKIQHLAGKDVITIKLPGVKSKEDVEVKRLEQSLEIRGFAKDKVYFKLIPIPTNSSVSHEFEDESLRIEIRE